MHEKEATDAKRHTLVAVVKDAELYISEGKYERFKLQKDESTPNAYFIG